jgi:hypothetical protein
MTTMRLGYINHDFSMFDSHPFFSERQDSFVVATHFVRIYLRISVHPKGTSQSWEFVLRCCSTACRLSHLLVLFETPQQFCEYAMAACMFALTSEELLRWSQMTDAEQGSRAR